MTHTAPVEWAIARPGAVMSMAAMWMGMMTVMMAPVAWPWLAAVRGLVVPGGSTTARAVATLLFAGGYLSAWLAYAVAAATVQSWLQASGMLDAHGALPGTAGAVVLIGAGLFQITPVKRACLTHCRSPLSFLLNRWQNGPPSPYRIGLSHGLYCVTCCWALMLTMLAVGLTNVGWMAALTAAVFVEQVVRYGDRIRVPIGVALIVAGLLR